MCSLLFARWGHREDARFPVRCPLGRPFNTHYRLGSPLEAPGGESFRPGVMDFRRHFGKNVMNEFPVAWAICSCARNRTATSYIHARVHIPSRVWYGRGRTDRLRITFHGAARQVTGSAHLLEINGKRILLDCGLFDGDLSLIHI